MDLLELEVGEAAQGGWCVAREPSGRVVLVRHALPGERVLAQVTESTARFARADAVRVLAASPDRVEPHCPHAHPGGCGGCDWQHASLAAQRRLKAVVISQQLRRIAGLDRDVTVEALPGDPAGLGWRTRVRFAVGPDGTAGLRKHRSHEVVDVRHCPIAHPLADQAGVTTRPWPGAGAVQVIAAPGTGQRALVVTPATGPPQPARPAGVDLARSGGRGVAGGRPPQPARPAGPAPARSGGRGVPGGRPPQPARPAGPAPARSGGRGVPGGRPPGPAQRYATWVEPGTDPVLVAKRGGGLAALRGGPFLTQRAAGRDWRVSAGVFWQVHPAVADALTAAVQDALRPRAGDVALDLYCGAGLFAGVLAGAVGPSGTVIGIESDQAAVRDARHNLRATPWARVHRGDVAQTLARADWAQARIAVLDPPRAGAGRAVLDQLLAAGTGLSRVAYVSCDPATLARDIGTFGQAGWQLGELRAFDAFPMTHHVECVATLSRG